MGAPDAERCGGIVMDDLFPPLDDERINDLNPEKELFDMVYGWGRYGTPANYTATAYQEMLNTIKERAILLSKEQPF